MNVFPVDVKGLFRAQAAIRASRIFMPAMAGIVALTVAVPMAYAAPDEPTGSVAAVDTANTESTADSPVSLIAQSEATTQSADTQSSESQSPAEGPVALDPSGADVTPPEKTSGTSLVKPLADGGVSVDTLAGINPDSVGVLDERQGGFGEAMWAGTPRALIESALPQLPVSAASPTMRDMMRRLLLSRANVPDETAPQPENQENAAGSLVVKRVDLLSAMGDLDGLNRLLEITPGRDQNRKLMRAEVDARLLTNDHARACELASHFIDEHESIYWQKVFMFCQTLAGQHEQAQLGISLLSELGEEDPVFFSMIEGLASGKTVELKSLSDPTPLHLAVARVGKIELPADVIASNQPGLLRTVAVSPNASVALRLEAAERADSAGALPVDALRQLYASIPFNDQEIAGALTRANQRGGAMTRALLYRAALSQTSAPTKAEAVARALDLAREGGRYTSTVRAFLPVIAQISPSNDLLWFAPEAVRAFLVSGSHDAAMPWFNMLSHSQDADDRRALAALMPVARLSGFAAAGDWDMEKLGAWWDSNRKAADARDRAALLYALYDALGEWVPDGAWEPLASGTTRSAAAVPHAGLWFRLLSSSSNARVGETVLLSLLALGEGGPVVADPVILHGIVGALRTIGLDKEARALAVEAVLTAGL